MTKHAPKPSLGLMGDNDQLSPLDHGPLSPQQTNIQMELEDEVEGDDAAAGGGGGHGPIDEEEPTPAIALNLDPALSGTFPPASSKCTCGGCLRAILNFPALSTIFPVTLVTSIFFTFINMAAAMDAFKYLADNTLPSFMPSPTAFAITLIFTLFLIVYALLATRQLLYQLFQGEIKPLQIVGLYLSTILLYGDLYQLCLLTDMTSFSFQQGTGSNATTNVVSVFVAFQYYSVTTITCTGFGDIVPTLLIPKVIAASQLLMSLFYHIGIFSIGLEHFQNHIEAVNDGKKKLMDSGIVGLAREKMRDLRTKYPKLDAIRKFFIAAVFPISLLIQIVFLVILHLYDKNMFTTGSTAAGGIIFIFFVAQVVQFILILLMTLALVRQINKSYVSPGFLLQSWLATVSLFCGLYVLIYLIIPGFNSFYLFPDYQSASSHQVAEVVGQFAWFSLCTMTTTGYGDVVPVHLVARLVVCCQMIVSVCYTVVILGQALSSTVSFINQIRVQRGAGQLKSSYSKNDGSGGEEENVETITLPPGTIEEGLEESSMDEGEEENMSDAGLPPPPSMTASTNAAVKRGATSSQSSSTRSHPQTVGRTSTQPPSKLRRPQPQPTATTEQSQSEYDTDDSAVDSSSAPTATAAAAAAPGRTGGQGRSLAKPSSSSTNQPKRTPTESSGGGVKRVPSTVSTHPSSQQPKKQPSVTSSTQQHQPIQRQQSRGMFDPDSEHEGGSTEDEV